MTINTQMKMCVLPNTDNEPSLATSHRDDGTVATATKTRCSSFDRCNSAPHPKKNRTRSHSYVAPKATTLPLCREKRTNSDDESENKESEEEALHNNDDDDSSSSSNRCQRDPSAVDKEDATVSPTNRLDALAAMASEAKRSLVHEDEDDDRTAMVANRSQQHLESNYETPVHESADSNGNHSQAITARVTSTSETSNKDSGRPPIDDVAGTNPSSQLPLPGSIPLPCPPPYDRRYPTSASHYMHPPRHPGYRVPPHPYPRCYIPSPVIPPYYPAAYYPPPPHPTHPPYSGSVVSTASSSRGRPSSTTYHSTDTQFDRRNSYPTAAVDLNHGKEEEAEKVSSSASAATTTTTTAKPKGLLSTEPATTTMPRKPSMEGLPLKKRKFLEVASAVEIDFGNNDGSTTDVADSRRVKSLTIDLRNDGSKDNNNDGNDMAKGDKHLHSEKSNETSSSGSDRRQKIERKTTSSAEKAVTPSPRNIESGRSGSSSSSVKTTGMHDKTNHEPSEVDSEVQDNCETKKKMRDMKSPSPPAVVHPSCLSNNTAAYPHGFPPIHRPQGHKVRPHRPSPPRAAHQSSSNHRPPHEVGLLSPPKHPFSYPRMSHFHPHYPPYPTYHPPHGTPQEVVPYYWHPHPHRMPAASHGPPQHPVGRPVGSIGLNLNHKPVNVSSSNSKETNAKKATTTNSCNKELENASKEPSKSSPVNVGGNANESTTDDPYDSKRCVHLYGPMLVHYMG